MLILPDSPDENPCVVGIDPGSTNLGVCVMYFDPDTLQPTRIIPRTYRGDKVGMLEWESFTHGERYARIAALRRTLTSIFREHNPVHIGSESSFYNQKRPSAFMVLIEVLCSIRAACVAYSPYTPLCLIDPSSVKNAVGAKGDAKKDPVKLALLRISEIATTSEVPIDDLDEHSVDAVGVAYAMLKKLKLNELLRKE